MFASNPYYASNLEMATPFVEDSEVPTGGSSRDVVGKDQGGYEVEPDSLGGELGLSGLLWVPLKNTFLKPREYIHFWIATAALAVAEILMGTLEVDLQWHWFTIYTWVLLIISPWTQDPNSFFAGSLSTNSKPSYSFTFLSSSTFISWIFAKSVYNASTLGYAYGIVGGVGYAMYYTAFFSVAIVVYFMRKKGYTSLPEAVYDRYGMLACLAFAGALVYRLYNEIWSNALVVASFFGAEHSLSWWIAVWASSLIPMLYVWIGGMKSSLISDVIQAVFAVAFLIIVLAIVGPKADHSFGEYNASWTMKGGVDFLLLGLVQGAISYPYFDPVLTDRAFLAKPKVMVSAFFVGGLFAGAFIILFSFLGIYGKMAGLKSGTPATVSESLGLTVFSITNLISMTSSVSTVDSTFSSLSKLCGLELYGLVKERRPVIYTQASIANMNWGRLSIIVLCIAGTLPLIAEPKALDATTISGTIVMGLGPCMILLPFISGNRPLAFHLPFWFGVGVGIAYQDGRDLSFWSIGDGKYANLLGVNVYGALICLGLFCIGYLWNRGEAYRLKSLFPDVYKENPEDRKDEVEGIYMSAPSKSNLNLA